MKNNQDNKNRLQGTHLDPQAVLYEIKVQGQLDLQRSRWFEGMTLRYIENSESGSACTLIAGPVVDQPALHGLLNKIRDLNLTLISVRRIVLDENTLEAENRTLSFAFGFGEFFFG